MVPDWIIPRSGRRVPLDRPLVMGILNLNDDSFCHDGTLDQAEARRLSQALLADGADFIDVGAESARTNRGPITPDEEIRRLRPLLESWDEIVAAARPLDAAQLWPPLLSVNTWRPEVAEAVLTIRCDLLNDMGALPDDRNAQLCARHGASLLIMHSVGRPKEPHTHQRWDDILAALDLFFAEKIALAAAAGLSREAIVLDPGLDFAKQRDDNLAILGGAGRLARFGRPVLLPVSRKTVIGEVLGQADPRDRDPGTVACLVAGALRLPGCLFRVHNVRAAAQSVRILRAVAEEPV